MLHHVVLGVGSRLRDASAPQNAFKPHPSVFGAGATTHKLAKAMMLRKSKVAVVSVTIRIFGSPKTPVAKINRLGALAVN